MQQSDHKTVITEHRSSRSTRKQQQICNGSHFVLTSHSADCLKEISLIALWTFLHEVTCDIKLLYQGVCEYLSDHKLYCVPHLYSVPKSP